MENRKQLVWDNEIEMDRLLEATEGAAGDV